MPEDRKIDYIELPASNFDEVQAFYSAVFDWQFTDYGEDYRAFTDGRLEGGFYASAERSLQSTGAALVVFYARDLEATEAAVLAAGGAIHTSIFAFPGGRRFHFTDPQGNELAVWTDQERQ